MDRPEVNAAEAALRRLAGDESERVAQAARAVLRVWEVEQGRRQGEAEQRTVQANEERHRPERPEEAPRPVPPPAKFVASVPPVEAPDAEGATVPVEPPTPAPPAPSGDTPAGDRPARRRLLVAGLALAGLLVAGGVAYAQYGRDGGEKDTGGRRPRREHRADRSPSPTTPADEQCTDEIKSNPRWVCLTSAVIANGKITIKYTVDYAGSTPNINPGTTCTSTAATAKTRRTTR